MRASHVRGPQPCASSSSCSPAWPHSTIRSRLFVPFFRHQARTSSASFRPRRRPRSPSHPWCTAGRETPGQAVPHGHAIGQHALSPTATHPRVRSIRLNHSVYALRPWPASPVRQLPFHALARVPGAAVAGSRPGSSPRCVASSGAVAQVSRPSTIFSPSCTSPCSAAPARADPIGIGPQHHHPPPWRRNTRGRRCGAQAGPLACRTSHECRANRSALVRRPVRVLRNLGGVQRNRAPEVRHEPVRVVDRLNLANVGASLAASPPSQRTVRRSSPGRPAPTPFTPATSKVGNAVPPRCLLPTSSVLQLRSAPRPPAIPGDGLRRRLSSSRAASCRLFTSRCGKVRVHSAFALQLGRQRLACFMRRLDGCPDRCTAAQACANRLRCRRLGHDRRCPPTQCRAALSHAGAGKGSRSGVFSRNVASRPALPLQVSFSTQSPVSHQ